MRRQKLIDIFDEGIMISINEEDISNIKSAIKRLMSISDPGFDLDIFSLQSIVNRWQMAMGDKNEYKM